MSNLDFNKIAPIFSNEESDEEGGVVTIRKTKLKRPPKYKVLLHNDDYTTMEFVIFILQSVFGKDSGAAQKIMLMVHTDGVGVCGVYSHEVAETKVSKVTSLAKENSHPLLCTMEAE